MQFKLFSLIALSTIVIAAPFPTIEGMLERGAAETAELLSGEGRATSGLAEQNIEGVAEGVIHGSSAQNNILSVDNFATEVRLLLESKQVNGYVLSSALRKASSTGRTDIVNLILNSDVVITSSGVRFAIEDAVKNGHTAVVELLLNSKKVTSDDVKFALRKASSMGRTDIVNLILNSDKVISSVGIRFAIEDAAKNGHTAVVELFLNSRKVTSDDIKFALRKASRNGHTDIVNLILNSDKVISSAGFRYAIEDAAENGHPEIARLIQQHQMTISRLRFSHAFEEAANHGHASNKRKADEIEELEHNLERLNMNKESLTKLDSH